MTVAILGAVTLVLAAWLFRRQSDPLNRRYCVQLLAISAVLLFVSLAPITVTAAFRDCGFHLPGSWTRTVARVHP
jgi:hypothetical protein